MQDEQSEKSSPRQLLRDIIAAHPFRGFISDIENTEIVFKDGVGYDSEKLLKSALGRYGQY